MFPWWVFAQLVGCGVARCAGLAEADCTGPCAPVVGRSCADDADTYIGCTIRDDDAVCSDITWICASHDDPGLCVTLPCYFEDRRGWDQGCPLDSTPCDTTPECPP